MNTESLMPKLCVLLVVVHATLSFAEDAKTPLTAPASPKARQVGLCGGVVMVPVKDNSPRVAAAAAGDFFIDTSYNANVTASQRVVIAQAVSEWQAIIRTRGFNPGNYLISFENGPLAAPRLAVATVSYDASSGNLLSALITISNTVTFFIDGSPGNDAEFPPLSPTGPAGTDLLSVIRHEIGHAIGWTSTKRTTDLIVGQVFDAPRMNIGIALGTGLHSSEGFDPDGLMNPSLSAGERRNITVYPAAALPARAFGYQLPVQFVDPAASGNQYGTAYEPWQGIAAADSFAPPDVPLLLVPTVFNVLPNATFSGRHTYDTIRGTATIRTP